MGQNHLIPGIQILFLHPHWNLNLPLNLFNFYQIFIVAQIRLKYLLLIEYFKWCRTYFEMFHSFILFKMGLIINRIIHHLSVYLKLFHHHLLSSSMVILKFSFLFWYFVMFILIFLTDLKNLYLIPIPEKVTQIFLSYKKKL